MYITHPSSYDHVLSTEFEVSCYRLWYYVLALSTKVLLLYLLEILELNARQFSWDIWLSCNFGIGIYFNSAEMLANLGVPWVIIGHSERRLILNESSEVNQIVTWMQIWRIMYTYLLTALIIFVSNSVHIFDKLCTHICCDIFVNAVYWR